MLKEYRLSNNATALLLARDQYDQITCYKLFLWRL